MALGGIKDGQTVTADSQPVGKVIHGVSVRMATVHPDERGELCEIFNPAWGFEANDPLVYAYMSSVRPGRVKGWIYHEKQWDRVFSAQGFTKWVLYDPREESPTRGMVQVLHLTERNRALFCIPPLVVHAVQNIGTTDAMFVNLPTRAYRHDDPDKFRVPPDQVPYSFESVLGW